MSVQRTTYSYGKPRLPESQHTHASKHMPHGRHAEYGKCYPRGEVPLLYSSE